ncbi:hypothetical protein [Sulfurimonas sp.]|uniref:hypothetical protein n=1 Tax=Sulfurimonas sp. TaxID=2022749 RepID=UPI001A02C1D5|nr:hypothetical protein [Sulfurimonas sp.]MBE0514827.1 hypothetical protein [Sulfurimonas sp.]
MKYIIILILFFTTLLLADHKVQHINKELSHLNLSKEQSFVVKEILYEFRTQLKEFKKFKDETELKKKDIFLKEHLNIDDIESLDSKLDAKSREIEKNFLMKIHAVLSREQKMDFVNYFDDWEVK